MRYFLAVVDAGTFTAAARELSIVQSAVSQQVARLERELGTALFDRTRRSPVLTVAGQRFLPAARDLVEAERAARRSVSTGPVRDVLRIGVTAGLDHRTGALTESRPIEAIALPSAERQAGVADGDLDAALVHGLDLRPDLLALPLGAERLVAVVAHRHPLAGRVIAGVGELAPLPLVLAEGARGTTLADVVLHACRAEGVEPDVVTFAASVTPFAAVRATARSWTVFYAEQAAAIRPEPLHVRFLDLEPELTVPVHLVVRPERRAFGRRLACAMVAGAAFANVRVAGAAGDGGRPTVAT